MAMGVDQAGDQCAALAVIFEVRPLGARIAGLEALHHASVLVDDKAVEMDEAAGGIDGDAVYILDERVGESGAWR